MGVQSHDPGIMTWDHELKSTVGQPNEAPKCPSPSPLFFLSLFILRESVSRGGAEREGVRESQAGCTLSALSPTWG